MLASVCDEPNTPLRVENFNLAQMKHDEVRIQTLASGICHTDLSFWNGQVGSPSLFPIVFGHEVVGIVEAVGGGVSRCKPGDTVLGSIIPACGHCWHCVRQESQHCETTPQVSASRPYLRQNGSSVRAMTGLGSFSEVMQVNESSIVPIKSELPPEQLALIGCGVTTGVGAALWTAQVRPGSTVAVFGCGGVGQSVVQGARLAGAEQIFAVDPVALKRNMAQQLGATDLIDPGSTNPVESIRQATGGRGADYSFEVTGSPQVARQAFDSVRKRGIAVVVGMPPSNTDVAVSGRSLFFEEKQLRGSLYGSAQAQIHLPMIVELAEQGRLDLGALVSKLIGLEDINEAFDAMRKGEVIRSVIRFT